MGMSFYADLHIHSKYSRATSPNCDLENLAWWGRKKGITVIGTGDFTHPAWFAELREKLVPAEPGLYRLREDLEREITKRLPPSCHGPVRFMLSVEISTIYKKGDKTRKVHHLIYAPDLEKAAAINQKLGSLGNIRSDGRPILGLDSRHLLEITLEAGRDCFLVPAHIWTPWFSVLGSKSGFDSVAECYGDLADHIFAVETGLSSDPEMNWRVSGLDRYRLISNSDAHSPAKLGREACAFDTDIDYYSLRRALETGEGYAGTVEFFPEEGKYHMDGHRKCGVRLCPHESRSFGGLCPMCKKPLTLGVMYRVEELSDRSGDERPATAADFKSLIPLPEIISEIHQAGTESKKVVRDYENLIAKTGSELDILRRVPADHLRRAGSSLLAEAVTRMREGRVIREAGYDGEYGRIRLFQPDELKHRGSAGVLFDVEPAFAKAAAAEPPLPMPAEPAPPAPAKPPARAASCNAGPEDLDEDQKKALETTEGPLLIIAGPGSGKTRTLTCRVAALIRKGLARPGECLTITFTRRAAGEMRERLRRLIPEEAEKIPVMTFHSLALSLLSENRTAAGLPRGFRIAPPSARRDTLTGKGFSAAAADRALREISLLKRTGASAEPGSETEKALAFFEEQKERDGLIDYDDLLVLALKLLEDDPGLARACQERYRHISVDEYQDIDDLQYRLVRKMVPESGNLCVIGDPDQAIYGFRGADVSFFLRFREDFPAARELRLSRNYRSGPSIIEASSQVILPSTLVLERRVEALIEDAGKIVVHHARSDRAEAEFIVRTIEEMMGGVSFFSMDSGRSDGEREKAYGFGDFAVLYRTETIALALEEALARSGIPFGRHNHEPLIEHPAGRHLLSLADSGSAPASDVLTFLRERREDFAPGLSPETCPQLARIEMLAALAGSDWERFLSELCLDQSADAWDPRAGRVSLLTAHASKGLEFPVVFIAGCENGVFPLFWGASAAPEEVAEERRLFYVAMTRARDRLVLSHAARRLWKGKVREQEISPFLRDIEERLLERNLAPHRKSAPPAHAQLDLF